MAHQSSNFMLELIKLLCIALLKISALLLAFTCKLLSFILEKIGEILESMTGYGHAHK